MELKTGEYSRIDETGIKQLKYLLKCDEHHDKWFQLLKILYDTKNKDVLIIKTLYYKKKDIVLKICVNENKYSGLLNSLFCETVTTREFGWLVLIINIRL